MINRVHIACVDGESDDSAIADIFRRKFSNVDNSDGTGSNTGLDSNVPWSLMSDFVKWLLTVEDVDKAVFTKLKRGKASGCDGLAPEHLVYSHPILILHLKRLFNLMLKHGYAPDKFDVGIIVPLVKDRYGDVNCSENYRAITISSVISKVFEICGYDKLQPFLEVDDLQYGFKHGCGCNTAVFTLQHVVKYYSVSQKKHPRHF